MCQQNKIITHCTRPTMSKIPMDPAALPFQQIAMDLIIGLPESNRHDSILTIVDHGCSRTAVFRPCSREISGPKVRCGMPLRSEEAVERPHTPISDPSHEYLICICHCLDLSSSPCRRA